MARQFQFVDHVVGHKTVLYAANDNDFPLRQPEYKRVHDEIGRVFGKQVFYTEPQLRLEHENHRITVL